MSEDEKLTKLEGKEAWEVDAKRLGISFEEYVKTHVCNSDKNKFENPEPNPGESQKDFVSRCISYMAHKEPQRPKDQVIATCYSIWRRKHEGKEDEKTFEAYMESMGYEKFTESAEYVNIPNLTKTITNNKSDNLKMVAMVGDKFMNGGFFPMKELRNCYKMWERTYHDYNHEGTNSGTFGNRTDITKFIGFHKNVELDEINKRVTMELVPVKETVGYKAWNGFIELAKQAGSIPNVSVTYWGKRQFIKTSELPNEADWKREGFKESDMVPVLHNVIPVCVSTVLEGKCNAQAGCGIQNTNSKCGSKSCDCNTTNAELEEQIKRIKEKEKKLKSED